RLTVDAHPCVRMSAWSWWRAPVAKIETGAEAAPGTRQDDNLAVFVAADFVERIVKLADEVVVDRVQSLWTIEADHGDERLDAFDVHGGHAWLRSRGPDDNRNVSVLRFSCRRAEATRWPTAAGVGWRW